MASLRNLWQVVKSAFSKDIFGQGVSDLFGNIGNAFSNWSKQTFGTGVTDRERELNAMNMQNVEDTASAQVEGYRKAGINTALMYGNGASNSAPQTTAAPGSSNLSELMQAIMIPTQLKMLNAQIGNVKAQTLKTYADTDQIKQVMEWYPKLTENQIKKLVSAHDLDIANISLAEAKAETEQIEQVIKRAEADEAGAFYKARREYEEAKTPEAKANAAAALARAAWDEYQTDYTKSHDGAMPSSSSILALVNAITSWLGVSGNEVGHQVTEAVVSAMDDVKGIGNKAIDVAGKTKVGKKVKSTAKRYLPNMYNQFKSWLGRK